MTTETAMTVQPIQGNVSLDYRRATDAANLCKSIVTATAIEIAKRRYVRVEGWQAIAVAHGCMASARDVERIAGGIRAIGEVRRGSDGAVLCTAEGFVGDDETTWSNRQEYAKRAMAQTRAISRACRSAFAHVVVMMDAGLETTPAEEVPEGGFDAQPKRPPVAAPTARATAPAGQTTTTMTDGSPNTITGIVEAAGVKKGSSAKGQWEKLGVKVNGEWFSTFDTKIAQPEKGEAITVTFKDDGKFKTLLSWIPADAQPESREPGQDDDRIPFGEPSK